MLMFGDQTVRPRYQSDPPFGLTFSMYFALNSVLMTSATWCSSGAAHDAAIPIAWGKTVATSARATPCRPSFHQLYSGIPRRGIAGAVCPNWPAFSSSVILEMSALTRTSAGSDASLNFARKAAAGGSAAHAMDTLPRHMMTLTT